MIMLNNNLRIFITAAELKSLTETSKKLYVSQPAISQAIRKLEEELNVKLFIRSKRNKLILTDAGKDSLTIAYKMADLEMKLYQRAYEENHMIRGIVRIASVPVGISYILSRVIPLFKNQYPDVQIELLEGTASEVRNMVMDYKADIGITTSPYTGLEHKRLMMDKMISIHRDCSVIINLEESVQDLILCRGARDSISEHPVGQKINFSNVMLVEAASTQINLVKNSNGNGIISELMLSTIPNELVCGDVFPKMEIEISLVAHAFDELSVSANKIAKMILEHALVNA